ncbi:DNA-binding response regulator [Marinobacterium aestuarii]|uniref:DNA-binding response regulator n=1 Tax=Marinobacterium aestuarii TaxID=1821621 RepID=A0A1A9EY42_9GAMM|nr:response regulator [Marinobacterium aestuarii]ANG62815.1 DNA-binding response regulator [Marinobacterium aestuarii]
MSAVATVMVVDDDELTRQCLSSYFENEGFRVFCASNAEDAETLLSEESIELVLLDIRLPGKDGLTLTRELRVGSEIGIILVTGRDDDIDRLIGLECGADDYVTKPFNPREILARGKNLIRRVRRCQQPLAGAKPSANLRKFDRWTLNMDSRQLSDEQHNSAPLTEGEFQLLTTLMRHAGQTLSRDQLMDRMRNRQWAPSDRTIDVLIGRLRRKLQDNPADPRLILTVHGAGYLFTPQSTDCS